MQLVIETQDGTKWDFDLEDVFKTVMLCVIIIAAYNAGAYVEIETLKHVAQMCKGFSTGGINVTALP